MQDVIVGLSLLMVCVFPFILLLILYPKESGAKNIICRLFGHKVPKDKIGYWTFFTCEWCHTRSVCYGDKKDDE